MRCLLACFVGVALFVPVVSAQSRPAMRERGAIVKVNTTFDASCSGSTVPDFANVLHSWYKDVTNNDVAPWGHYSDAWWRDGFYSNSDMSDGDFTDSNIVSWGNDNGSDKVDEADAIMIGTHGTDGALGQWKAWMRVDESGPGDCSSWQGNMLWGDYDLEFAHVVACHSVDWDVRYSPGWSDTFDRLHQINGFHGVSYMAASFFSRYRDFADDSYRLPLYLAWYDNLYIPDVVVTGGGIAQQCPISRGTGSDVDDMWNRMDRERYNAVFTDPTSNRHGTIYVRGCDPRSEAALPN